MSANSWWTANSVGGLPLSNNDRGFIMKGFDTWVYEKSPEIGWMVIISSFLTLLAPYVGWAMLVASLIAASRLGKGMG